MVGAYNTGTVQERKKKKMATRIENTDLTRLCKLRRVLGKGSTRYIVEGGIGLVRRRGRRGRKKEDPNAFKDCTCREQEKQDVPCQGSQLAGRWYYEIKPSTSGKYQKTAGASTILTSKKGKLHQGG